MTGSGSTAHRPLAKTDQWSVNFVFDSEGMNPQQALLPPIKLQPPSAIELTTMAMLKGKIKEPTSNSEKNHMHSLASALSVTVFTFIGFCFFVMCWLWLGPKAPALAWL